MGFPYTSLVAPAVLWRNPGVTREEFTELLDDTHPSSFREYSSEEEWDYYDPRFDDEKYHKGIEGLANILCLSTSSEYNEFQKVERDGNGLIIEPPYFLELSDQDMEKYNMERYVVLVHRGNIIGSPERKQEMSLEKLREGDIWEECMMGLEKGIVTKIFNEQKIGISSEDEDYFFGEGPQYEYNIEIKPIKKNVRKEQFSTMEKLLERWPQFHHDYVYDWGKKEGAFFTAFCGRGKFFLWCKEDERYYLDQRTFDLIPAGTKEGHFGYTDLVLTSGALEHRAWKLLSYRGFKHIPDFLGSFPDVKEKYNKAVWDSHTSLKAREKGMSTYDLIRIRAIGPNINKCNMNLGE